MKQRNDAQIAQDLKSAVAGRHDMDSQSLAEIARSGVTQSKVSRGLTRDILVELKRRFKILPKELNPDGSRRMIDGAKSFTGWLKKHRIPLRNVFYVMAGRKPDLDIVTVRLTRREYTTLRYLLRHPRNKVAESLRARFLTREEKRLQKLKKKLGESKWN